MYKYIENYYKQNVEILRYEFMKFSQMVKQEFKVDVFNVMSEPTLAYQVLVERLLKNPYIKCYCGILDPYHR